MEKNQQQRPGLREAVRREIPGVTPTTGGPGSDTLGHLLALAVTPANEQDRTQLGPLAEAVQAEVQEPVKVAFVDQGYTGDKPAAAAAKQGSNCS